MRPGFTLLEALIFCAISALIGVAIMSVAHQVHEHCYKERKRLHALAQLVGIYTLMNNDIAHADLSDFLPGQYVCCFRTKEQADSMIHVEWVARDGHLLRSQGEYDVVLKRWRSRAQSLVASGIEEYRATLHSDIQSHATMVQVALRIAGLDDFFVWNIPCLLTHHPGR